jgi:hypothetical protein
MLKKLAFVGRMWPAGRMLPPPAPALLHYNKKDIWKKLIEKRKLTFPSFVLQVSPTGL